MQIPGCLPPASASLRALLAGLHAPPAAQPSGIGQAPEPSGTAGSEAPADPSREPTLRDVLTPEERAFFDECSAAGAWTYGPSGSRMEPPQGPTGSRVDLRG